MKIVNLTPHTLNIKGSQGDVAIPPSGLIARVSVTAVHVDMLEGGILLFENKKGEVQGLPPPEEGNLYVVSALVREAVPGRQDVASPGELVRDAQGQPVGCRGLVVNR